MANVRIGGRFFAGLQAILGRVGVQGVDSNLATALRTVVVLVFAWGIVLAQGTLKTLGSISPRTSAFLVLSGLATGTSWLFYFHALKIAPRAAGVATLDKLSLVFVVVLAAIFLRETVGWKSWCGVAFIISGALLISSDKKPDDNPKSDQAAPKSTHAAAPATKNLNRKNN